jgi:hypothetical protein
MKIYRPKKKTFFSRIKDLKNRFKKIFNKSVRTTSVINTKNAETFTENDDIHNLYIIIKDIKESLENISFRISKLESELKNNKRNNNIDLSDRQRKKINSNRYSKKDKDM